MTDVAMSIVIDPKKLGIEGNRLLGEVETLAKWGAMFAGYAQQALDLRERKTLVGVSNALLSDVEAKKTQLARLAMARGAGKLTPVDEDDDAGAAA